MGLAEQNQEAFHKNGRLCSVSLPWRVTSSTRNRTRNLKGIKEEKPKGVTMACSLKPFWETGFPKMVTVYNNKG